MFKHIVTAALCCWWFCCAPARAGASLTAQETRWLRAAGPVPAFSQRLQLPIDIIVQPTAGPGDVPMASPTWRRWFGRSATIRSIMRG